ncbi:glycosyltransferase [Akkermansiaceae bacterium]|nr:glycosyltransferase [Akkermansiaceae bacterium]MDB4388020.1 glycosyltransferase [Akkermansiaceae bacterium]MDB4467355.1 glycosyltransferase [Akkermansiaceae bacterium]
MSLSQQVSISIASKDRHEVLEETLRKIHAFGLGDYPVIVCDDGSEPAMQPEALGLFADATLLRNEQATGQALARNRIAEVCKTPYLLQLDDDSYPVAGSLEKLVETVEAEDNWLAVAIPFEEPARGRCFPEKANTSGVIVLSAFVGCSVLLHVERFKRLGGYAEWIGRCVEEEELCVRSFLQGMRVIQLDSLKIRHEVTAVARSNKAICYRSFRNWTATWLLCAPPLLLPLCLLRMFALSLLDLMKNRRLESVTGLLAGIRLFVGLSSYGTRLSLVEYRRYRGLPHALSLFNQH